MTPGGPPGDGNPLLDLYRRAVVRGGSSSDVEAARDDAITRYGFAIPTEEALRRIADASPAGVVELGAGTGYWAHALARLGVDVVAYDLEPPPSAANPWFAGTEPWHPVQRGDASVVERHGDRTLLLVWPTKDQVWAADALERYHRAGGASVAYVGEGPGGHTGDDVFHARLGQLTTCAHCRYGVTTSPCITGVEALWRRVETVALPHWPGYADDLHLHARLDAGHRSSDGGRGRWRDVITGRGRRP